MSFNEAKAIATRAVYLATKADTSSASHINFVNLTKEGGLYEKIINKTSNH